MRRVILVSLLGTVLLLATAVPTGAIIGGEIDGTLHPNVGMVRFTQDGTRYRCSGTLVAPAVVLTAAHCTAGSTNVMVSFDSVGTRDPLAPVDPGDPSRWITGTAHANPLYNPKLQLKDLNDIGVVVLDASAASKWPGIAPAALPTLNYLGVLALKGGLKNVPFTAVGYGVFFEKPADGPQRPEAVRDLTRRWTTAPMQNLAGQTIKLQENSQDSKFGGGTCFGDSGGALFLNGLLVGDTSWGGSQFCSGGVGGYQRTDTHEARAFLDDYMAVP